MAKGIKSYFLIIKQFLVVKKNKTQLFDFLGIF